MALAARAANTILMLGNTTAIPVTILLTPAALTVEYAELNKVTIKAKTKIIIILVMRN
jgi:hypothetical protein